MVRECKISDLALDQHELDRIGLYPSNHIVSETDDDIIERIRVEYAAKDKVRKKRNKQVVQDRKDAPKISSTPLPAIPTPLAKIQAMRVVRRVPRTAKKFTE